MKHRVAIIDLTGPSRPRPGAGPLARICGLPLLTRNLVLLEEAGYAGAALVCAEADRDLVRPALRAHPRLSLAVRFVTPGAGALQRAADAFSGAAALLVLPGALTWGRYLPSIATGPLPPEGGVEGVGPDGEPLGVLLLCASVARGARDAAEARGRLAAEGRLRTARATAPTPPVFVDGEPARARAERLLLVSLRKAADGFVARYDRHISLAISRHLMRLPIPPNAVTVAAGLFAIAMALVAAKGGYAAMLVAAAGFYFQGLLDGIDGEIARAKLLTSLKGQWLDTLFDDTANAVFMGAIAVGAYRTTGYEGYLVLGAVAVLGQVMSSALMYHYIWTVHRSGDLNDFRMPWQEEGGAPAEPASALGRLVVRAQFLFRRDTFAALSLLLAVFGRLELMVWFFAIGGTAVWVSILGYRALRAARRPPRAKEAAR